MVYAYDRNVSFGKAPFYESGYYNRLSNDQSTFEDLCNQYNEFHDPYGQIEYWKGYPLILGIPTDILPIFDFSNNKIMLGSENICANTI